MDNFGRDLQILFWVIFAVGILCGGLVGLIVWAIWRYVL